MPPPVPAAVREYVRPPRPSYRRALIIGLAISVAVHVLVLVLAWRTRVVVVPGSAETAPAVAVRGGERGAMRVERIVPVPEAAPESDRPVREERDEPRPERRPGPAREDAPTVEVEPGPALPPAERLRPRMGDPRLWTRPGAPAAPEPSDMERVRTRIADRLGEWNDSVAAEAGRAARARDWTVEDGNGGKWGISPGKIHLGPLTLPLPVNLTPPPGQREAAAERARRDGEIRDQEARSRADDSFRDRVKAIRERKAREREEKKAGSGTGEGKGVGKGEGRGAGTGTGTGTGTVPGSG